MARKYFLPELFMTTETENLDPATQAPSADAPETSDQNPADTEAAPSDDIEKLKQERDAALTEAKRWKGRVEKATKKDDKTEKASLDAEEITWMIQNQSELAVYGNRVVELRQKGLDREEALKFARLEHVKTDTPAQENQAAVSGPSNVAFRTTKTTESLSEIDQRLGVTSETKAKWKDVVEGA